MEPPRHTETEELSRRALVPWQRHCSRPVPPPGVPSFFFCVTYVIHLRTILEAFRPTCDLYYSVFFPIPLLSSHLL